MNRHPSEWTLLVAASGPKDKSGQDTGLARALGIADAVNRLTHRNVAEPVAWGQLKAEPTTTRTVKLVVLEHTAEQR